MANVLLLNPRKRKGKKRKSKKRKGAKRPSAAQMRARRKFARMSRARARAAKRYAPVNRTAARRRASKSLRRSVRSPFAGVTMARRRSKLKRNPSRRRRRRVSRRLRRNPARRLRRNPIVPAGFMRTHIKPALIGAAGGMINDVAVGALISKLPRNLQAPELRHLVKALTAIGLGIGASKLRIASSSLIHTGTIGALTCVAHDAARQQLQKMLPGVPLGGMDEYLLGEMLGPFAPARMPGLSQREVDLPYMPGSEFEECLDEVIS